MVLPMSATLQEEMGLLQPNATPTVAKLLVALVALGFSPHSPMITSVTPTSANKVRTDHLI